MNGMDPELFDQFIDQLERYVRERLIPAEREVIERLRIEDQLSWASEVRSLFQDMHLVWAAIGATASFSRCSFPVCDSSCSAPANIIFAGTTSYPPLVC